jgi:peptidoglycan-associated lipoprotein
MKKLWVAIGVALMVAGCGSDEVKQSKTDIEQRRLIEQENAAREARVRQEEQELARIRAEQRKREQSNPQTAQAEAPVIRSIEQANIEQEQIKEPESAPAIDPAKAFATRTIYYDYDAYNVREEYLPVMQAHGQFLLAHKDVKLRVEGNCDERGSREYNLALGQRRADSVKRALMLMGVPARQIETVSYGSEKPKVATHDERAYAENRRSDLVYLGGETALR